MARAARLSGAEPDDEEYQEFEEMLEHAEAAQVRTAGKNKYNTLIIPKEVMIKMKMLKVTLKKKTASVKTERYMVWDRIFRKAEI